MEIIYINYNILFFCSLRLVNNYTFLSLLILLIPVSILSFNSKEKFDLHADDLIDAYLKNVYKGKFEKRIFGYKSTTKMSKLPLTTQKQITFPKIFNAMKYPALNTYAGNLTMEEFPIRKRKIDIKVLLESNIGQIPKFDDNDEITVQTRRLNKLNESVNSEIFFREMYFDYDNRTFIYIEKNRTISLMAQFVYETRYQLPYAQLLRKKYIKNTKYRIGYCFSLLKTLKQQQMVIFNTMKTHLEKTLTLYWHMKMYEKVVKLNVDIRDVMKFIVDMDKDRQIQEDKYSTRNP